MNLKCPITEKFFKQPVMASDGQIYEYEVILEWYNVNKKSPITNKNITDQFYPVFEIQDTIRNMIISKEINTVDQYQPSNKIDFMEAIKKFNIFDINNILLNITPFTYYNLLFENTQYLIEFIKHNNENLIMTLIKQLEFLQILQHKNNNNEDLLFYITLYAENNIVQNVIKYYIDNNYNIHYSNKHNNYIIHNIAKRTFQELTDFLIDFYVEHNLPLNIFDKNKWNLIHHISKNFNNDHITKKLLTIFIDKKYSFYYDYCDFQIIHFITKYSSIDVIHFTLDLYIKEGYNLDCRDIKGNTPFNYIINKSNKSLNDKMFDHYNTHGYNYDSRNKYNQNILHFMAYKGDVDSLNYLLDLFNEKFYPVDVKDTYGMTPIKIIINRFGKKHLLLKHPLFIKKCLICY